MLKIIVDQGIDIRGLSRQQDLDIGLFEQVDVRADPSCQVDIVGLDLPPLEQHERAQVTVNGGRIQCRNFRIDMHAVGRNQ